MFERFTEDARRAVVLARDEALAIGSDQVGPAHVLLGLCLTGGPATEALTTAGLDPARVRETLRTSGTTGWPTGLDADALAALGIDLAQVRASAEAAFGPGALDPPPKERGAHIRFSDGAKQSLAAAVAHAFRHGGKRLDTMTVLVGVLAVGDPTVERTLRDSGVDVEDLRRRAEGTWDAA